MRLKINVNGIINYRLDKWIGKTFVVSSLVLFSLLAIKTFEVATFKIFRRQATHNSKSTCYHNLLNCKSIILQPMKIYFNLARTVKRP